MTAALACLLALAIPPTVEDEVLEPVVLEQFELTFNLPALEELTGGATDMGQVQARWAGDLDGARVRISLWVLEGFGFSEPSGVADLILDNFKRQDRPFQYRPQEVVYGKYGFVPYAVLMPYSSFDSTLEVGAGWVLNGLLPEAGYTVEVEIDAVPTDEQRAMLEDFLKSGVTYTGDERVPEWTEEEIESRMGEDIPSTIDPKDTDFIRTDHYIIFGNSSGAKAFAKNIEKCYDAIRDVFPFEEIDGQRLMPIFLFRTRDQYIDFIVEKIGWSRDQAARSAGIASGDWYATTYTDPKDPTHLHELTHQIFANRLLLGGGGSWFQEGVAVYMETVEYKGEANKVANMAKAASKRARRDGPDEAVEKGEYIRMKSIMKMASMLYSSPTSTSKGGSGASLAYDQAGSIIYFVMKDKRTKEKAQEFIHRVGSVRRSDMPAIERELQALWNLSIDEFEEWYIEFWKKGR